MTALNQQKKAAPTWQIYAIYVVMALLTFMFLMAGVTKLMGQEMHIENFARWGYPIWFMYLTGLIEVVSVILMWIPKTRFYGAVGLAVTMIGAFATHLLFAEFGGLPIVAVLFILAGLVAWFNRPTQLLNA